MTMQTTPMRQSWLPAITGNEVFARTYRYRDTLYGITEADYEQMVDDYLSNQTSVEDAAALEREAREYCAEPYGYLDPEAELAGYWVRLDGPFPSVDMRGVFPGHDEGGCHVQGIR